MAPKRMKKMAYRGEAKRRSTRLMSKSGKGSSIAIHEPVALEISSSKSSSRTETFHSANESVNGEGDTRISEQEVEIEKEVNVEDIVTDQIPNPEHEVPASENAQRTEPEVNPDNVEADFDALRFSGKAAELKYTDHYRKRAVLCERGIKISDYTEPPYELLELCEQRGWVSWVSASRRAVVPYVREFYANAEVGAVHGRSVITSKVRGKEITLNLEKITFIGHLPADRIPEATIEQKAQWEEQLNKDNLAKLFTNNPRAVWTTARLPKTGLTPKSNVIHMLVCSLILPHAYKSTITMEQAMIMGKLLLGIPIDLPYHIWLAIAHVVEKPESNAGLPFGGLITEVIQHFLGIEEEKGMAVVKPASLIGKTSVRRSQGQLGKKANPPATEDNQQQAEEGGNETAALSTEEKINLIQKNQEALMKDVAELKKGQQRVTRLLERIFESDREEEEE